MAIPQNPSTTVCLTGYINPDVSIKLFAIALDR